MEVMDTSSDVVASPKKEYVIRRLPILMKWKISEKALRDILTATTEATDPKAKSERSLFSRYCYSEFNLPKMFRGSRDAYGLTIYPDGKNDETKGEVWISMHMKFTGENWNRKCEFVLSIPSTGYSQTFEHEFNHGENMDGEEWEHRLCSTEELFNNDNKFFDSDNWMHLIVKGSYESDEDKKCYIVIPSKDGKLWEDEVGKDFTIVVGDKVVKAHKHVLLKQSSVFDVADNKLEITDFPFETVERCVDFCYGNDEIYSIEDMMQVCQFAAKYGMKKMLMHIDHQFRSAVSLSTVCDLANMSYTCNMPKLYDKCCRYLTRCLKKTTPVYDLDKLNGDIAMKVFKDGFCQYRCSPEEDDYDSLASEKSYDSDDEDMENGGGGDGCRQM